MATKIRGSTDDSLRMMLGQIRKVFDPQWIQGLSSGTRFTIQFYEKPDSEKELIQFAEMYGYEMYKEENAGWYEYYFKKNE